MNLLELHYKNTITKDFSSRFLYLNSNQISKINKIHLNIGIKSFILKKGLSNILALELISLNNPKITKSKKSQISLGIRKNSPTGLKLTLHKLKAYNFLQKLIFFVLPNYSVLKNKLVLTNYDNISFSLKEVENFYELTFFYNIFKNNNSIDVCLQLNNINLNNNLELLFYLTSLKFPVLQK